MNFGPCPYCSELLFLLVPDKTPAYAKVECDECGNDVWYRFSRVAPEAWTVEDFEASHIIDDRKKTIERRHQPKGE